MKLFAQALVQVFNKLLVFFRIIDEHDQQLSLTNLMIYAAIINMYHNGTGMVELGTLLAAVANYTSKKIINKDKQKDMTKLLNEINSIKEEISLFKVDTKRQDDVEARLTKLQNQVEFMKLGGVKR